MKKIKDDFFDEEISDYLDNFSIEYPSEFEIENTINSIREYVPKNKSKLSMTLQSMKQLTKHSTREMSSISFLFWIFNLLFFTLGLIYVLSFEGNPYLTTTLLTPIPLIFGLIEVFKGRETGLYEIEHACKYSLPQIISSRLFVIGGYNLVLNVILIISFNLFLDNILLVKLLGYWIVPYIFISAISLFITIRFKSTILVPTLFILWFVAISFLSQSIEIIIYLESMNLFSYLFFLIAGMMFLISQIKKIKRGVHFELNS